MTRTEAVFVEELRSSGLSWQDVGTTFGLADEAARSAYRRAKMKEIADGLKANGCSLCNERNPDCLDFHHTDPSIKLSAIADIMSRDALLAEAEKCFILCSNCHRKIHRTLYGLYSKIEKLTQELLNK